MLLTDPRTLELWYEDIVAFLQAYIIHILVFLFIMMLIIVIFLELIEYVRRKIFPHKLKVMCPICKVVYVLNKNSEVIAIDYGRSKGKNKIN